MRREINNLFFLKVIAITFFCLSLFYNASAKNTNDRYIYPKIKIFKLHKHVLAGGFSTSLESFNGVGLQGVYSYRFNPKFSLGLQGNFLIEGYNNYLSKTKSLYLGMRLSYHPITELLGNQGFDIYVSGSLGSYYRRTKFVLKPLMYLCISYDTVSCIGFYVEIGSAVTAGLRLHF